MNSEASPLDSLQHQLFQLIKTGASVSLVDDPYLNRVGASLHLEVLQEIIFQWRCYGLERSCILTSRLLKGLGVFDEKVRRFIRTQRLSPYFEEQAEGFLAMLATEPDALVAAVAEFEAAMRQVRAGDPACYVIEWQHDPYAVLNDLVRNAPGRYPRAQTPYQMLVSADLPDGFMVVGVKGTAPGV